MKKPVVVALTALLTFSSVAYAQEENRWKEVIEKVEFAEENFHGAALMLAKRLPDDQSKLELLEANLEFIWEDLSLAEGQRMLDMTYERSAGVPATSEKFSLLYFMTKEYLKAGNPMYLKVFAEIQEFEEQLQGIDRIQLAELYGLMGKPEMERQILDRIEVAGADPKIVENLARGYAQIGDYAQALELVKGVEDTYYFNMAEVFQTAVQNDELTVAWNLVDQLPEGSAQTVGIYGIAMGHVLQGDLKSGFATLDRIQFVHEIQKAMILQDLGNRYQSPDHQQDTNIFELAESQLGIVEKIYFYNGLVNNYLEQGFKMEAELPLAKLSDLAVELGEPQLFIQIAQYYALLERDDQVENALEQTRQMLFTAGSTGEDKISIEKIVSMIQGVDDRLMQQLIEKELAARFVELLAELVVGLEPVELDEVGRVEVILQLANLALKSDGALLVDELWEQMGQYVERLPQDQMRLRAQGLKSLAQGLTVQGKYEQALGVADRAFQFMNQLGDEFGKGQMLTLYLDLGNYDKYLELVRAKADYTIAEEAQDLLDLGRGSVQVGKLEQAERVLNQAIQLIQGKGFYFYGIQGQIGLEFIKMGKYEQAIEFLTHIESERSRLSPLTDLADLYVAEEKLEYLEVAQKIIGSMTDSYYRNRGMQIISMELIKHGQVKKGFDFLKMMDDRFEQAYTLTQLGIWFKEQERKVNPELQREIQRLLVDMVGK